MDDGGDTFFAGLIIGALAMFLLSIVLAATGNIEPRQNQKIQVICHYLHAEKHGNVCIKDGKVVYTP